MDLWALACAHIEICPVIDVCEVYKTSSIYIYIYICFEKKCYVLFYHMFFYVIMRR